MGSFTTTVGNLTFSFFIDWFNPSMNKTAGKTVSCDAIMLFCLNLLYHLRHKPKNTFFAGITPPHEPSVTTITALLDPIIDQLCHFHHGVIVRTYRHPEGINKHVGVLVLIGDLLAVRKALGFAGIASLHHFCSFCSLARTDIESLDVNLWRPRIGLEVIAAAEEWRQASTKKQRTELFNRNGVRWSSLHQLFYQDPVKHTVLGIMHNWLEGVLQYHVRVKWGIGTDAGQDPNTHQEVQIVDDMGMDLDEDIVDKELIELQQENQEHNDTPSHFQRLHSINTQNLMAMNIDDASNDDESDFHPSLDSDNDSQYSEVESLHLACIFDALTLVEIHNCITNVAIPSWVNRPPANLGEKSHGKLKADHWLTLFTVIFPLILPEIWSRTKTQHCYEITPKKETISCAFINLMGNIQEYNVGKI